MTTDGDQFREWFDKVMEEVGPDGLIRLIYQTVVRTAVEVEREQCAKVCDALAWVKGPEVDDPNRSCLLSAADAIRERGTR